MRFRFTVLALAACLAFQGEVSGHDIPNARVDRSIQAELRPGSLRIDYEVSLSELTLTQDLRGLIGSLPRGVRTDWFKRYGEETGPLNARGLLVTLDGEPVDLIAKGFDVEVDDHPRFTFHFEAPVPASGRLRLIDSNYAASEGTSRLAIRGQAGVAVEGDALPGDVDTIPIRPVWQLSAQDERRTKRVTVEYRMGPAVIQPASIPQPLPEAKPSPATTLTTLLDDARSTSWPLLAILSFFLGVAHSVQPGHGKSLVAAGSLGAHGLGRGVLLGLAATAGHLSTVTALAAILWVTGATDFARWNALILRSAGFWLAAMGLWRLGHHLGDSGQQPAHDHNRLELSTSGLVGIGLASGLVPCWDAVALLLLATALGRIGLGLILLVAFSLGMASVLVAVGLLASRLSMLAIDNPRKQRQLGIISGCVLAIMGALFLIC